MALGQAQSHNEQIPNRSQLVAAVLRAAGHDAVHVRGLGLRDASDDRIIDHVIATDRVVVSHDSDFGSYSPLAASASRHSSGSDRPTQSMSTNSEPHRPEPSSNARRLGRRCNSGVARGRLRSAVSRCAGNGWQPTQSNIPSNKFVDIGRNRTASAGLVKQIIPGRWHDLTRDGRQAIDS